jgi:hypothetical protein
MLLFGHPQILNEKFYHINSIEAIAHTPSNACLLLTYDEEVFELIEYARENDLAFAIDVSNLTEAIICENLDAKYLLVNDEIAKRVQTAADTYLFDAKVLVHIKEEEAIEALAEEGIDGAVFSEAIIKIS